MLYQDIVYRGPKGEPLPAFHVVITRYNLAVPHMQARVGNVGPVQQKHWLDRRLELFRTFCLPSMLAQTKRPDLWVLGFDAEAREAVAPVIEAVRDQSWIVPAWQNTTKGIRESYADCFGREILPRLTDDHSHVILSRVDNDDSLSRGFLDYVATYSAAVLAAEPATSDFWIFFPVGADYFKQRCWLYVYPGNPFPSRVQTRETFLRKQAYFVDHSKILRGDARAFMPLTSEPMWLRNMHGGNVVTTRQKGRLRLVPTATALASFGVKLDRPNRPGAWTQLTETVPSALRLLRRVARRSS